MLEKTAVQSLVRPANVFAFSNSPVQVLWPATMQRNTSRFVIAILTAAFVFAPLHHAIAQNEPAASGRAEPARTLRLYLFDCGTLQIADMSRFSLKSDEVATTDLSVACFLVAHPKGTLIWDTGAVPDSAWKPTGQVTTQHVRLPDSQQRDVTLTKSLSGQLAELGYSPADITYLALSHYHYDHTANANEFAGATWLVRQAERAAMFAEKAPGTTQPTTYAALRNSKTMILKTDDYDVFGDGTVVIKSAPGHTPGHQVLFVKLPKTGAVVLSGDLYHYPEERVLDRVPTFEFNPEQTRATRVAVDAFLKKTGAQLWIQHDVTANAKLKKSPAYYD
jgi:N-acyl homoserine lactone hydrolase